MSHLVSFKHIYKCFTTGIRKEHGKSKNQIHAITPRTKRTFFGLYALVRASQNQYNYIPFDTICKGKKRIVHMYSLYVVLTR